ncbi:MAG TPA: calcium/proton exchanger [Solirubrobacterales bacterium]|nr:calcium/proton exchanger [Solirubrobacterales bacterium]
MRPVYVLGLFIPIAIALKLADAPDTAVFFTAAIAVIPTAALMGDATEQLATRSGPGIGGLLNVTFGNAPELIIALFALGKGLQEVVKASIVGSIISNILLVLGAAMLFGGFGREKQSFNRTMAHSQAAMLLLALVAVVMPALFELIRGQGLPTVGDTRVDFGSKVEAVSGIVSGLLLFSYCAGLFFSLRTHRELFNPYIEETDAERAWPVRRSVLALALAGAGVAGMSELLVGSIEHAASSVGLSQFFIGAVVVAIVGNAAEHWVAVVVAVKNKMDLAVNIAVGSSAQVALFVAPLLVLLSFALGPHPMALVFNGYELAAMLLAVVIANFTTQEGESNWFEGLQLLAVYVVLCVVFGFA